MTCVWNFLLGNFFSTKSISLLDVEVWGFCVFIYFWLNLCCSVWPFSSCGAWLSLGGGYSCCRAQALGIQA